MIETLKQFGTPFSRWQIWFLMGNQDIAMRYKRSLIGPFWITLSLAAMLVGLGLLYGRIFEQDFGAYLYFLTAGFIVWYLFSAQILEGCVLAVEAEAQLRNVSMPLPVLAARMVYRNWVILLHNLVVVVGVIIYIRAPLTWEMLWVVPGIVVVLAIGFFGSLVLAPLCLRFRDVPQVVASVMQIAFFLTPILWMPTQGRVSSIVVNANPLYHMIELVRAPILGNAPTMMNWIYANSFLGVLVVAAIIAVQISRNKIYLWL